MMIAAVVLTTACSKNDDEPIIEPGPNQMTMTTQQSNVAILMRGYGTMTIDWGDKTEIETYSLIASVAQTYTHTYSGSTIHTIIITGDNITFLECPDNGLTKLNISKNLALTELRCERNPLKNLDVRSNSALIGLDCFDNELSILDVSKNTEIIALNCNNNQLTKLDLSNNSKMVGMSCNNNKLTSEALNVMFGTLHNNIHPQWPVKIIHIGGNPGTDHCEISIAENKGWLVNMNVW